MKVIATLFVVFLIVFASCHKHGHDKPDEEHKCHSACRFKIEDTEYNLRGLDDEIDIIFNEITGTIKFSPCGAVKDDECPPNTAVCLKVKEGVGVSFGSVGTLLFNKVPNANAIEGMYGNGELCNNGSPRKTIVQYVCDLTVPKESVVSVVNDDDCSLTITIASSFGCPIADKCASLLDQPNCESVETICAWNEDSKSCIVVSHPHKLHHIHAFSIIGLSGLLFLILTCSLCLCCVAIKRRRNRRRLQQRASFARRSSSKKSSKKNQSTPVVIPYQPLGNVQHFQLVPGNFAPVNGPYADNVIPMYPIVVQNQ